MERKTGFEPATTTLARWGSTGLSYFRSQHELSVQQGGFYRAYRRRVKGGPGGDHPPGPSVAAPGSSPESQRW
jgi:hypothetical protein